MGVFGDPKSRGIFSIEIEVGVLKLYLLGSSGGLFSIEEGNATQCEVQHPGEFGDILVQGTKRLCINGDLY